MPARLQRPTSENSPSTHSGEWACGYVRKSLLTRPLPTLCSRWAAGCYVRTQQEEEVQSEPGRANDTRSRLDRVGVRDGDHSSQLKASRQSRAALAFSDGRPTGSHTVRAADGGQVNFVELRFGEVRAEDRTGNEGNWSDRGNCTGGYSSTNSSTDMPYALAIFVTVGM